MKEVFLCGNIKSIMLGGEEHKLQVVYRIRESLRVCF